MTDDRSLPLEDAAGLRRMLRELGQAPIEPPRGVDAERLREQRMAEGIDAELEQLVRERRRRRWASGMAVAAAAALALVWGMHRPDYTSVAVPIAQEPVSPRVVAPSAPAAAPEDPPSVEPPRAPLAPVPRTVVSPSASASASPAASAESSSTAPAENESTLGEENRLFKAAAEASRSGNVPSAIQFLDQLLTQYPRSPLAQTALVRKFRLLADAGRLAEAVREAERYLSLYPMGFAVSEAQALKSRHEPIPAASDAEQDRPAPANEEAARP